MNKLTALAEVLKNTAINHPYLAGTAALFSLTILVLRKVHYRFVVFPQMGGRFNSSNRRGYRHPREQNMNSQDIQIISEGDVAIRGWYIKHNSPQAILIYYHQNAGNIGGRLYFIRQLMKRVNVNVLIVAYRGFSDSDGHTSPTEDNIMTDAKSILRKGIQLSKRDSLPLMMLGRSLGGASSINTLSQPQFKYAVKGLILQNTFTCIFDVAKKFIPNGLLFLRPLLWLITYGSYNSQSKMHNIHVPTLFIKGCRDQLIPKWQMDKLQDTFAYMKRQNYELLVKTGGHNDTWTEGGQNYFQTFSEFVGNCCRYDN